MVTQVSNAKSNRGLVLAAPGELELREKDRPVPGHGEVLLEVIACGLCGTDAHAVRSKTAANVILGTTLGHEIVGSAIDHGPGVPNDVVGQRFVVLPNIRCEQCNPCREGLVNLCDNFVHIGSLRDGGIGEYVTVPLPYLVPVPAQTPDRVAALAEPLGCALNGIQEGGWKPGDSALIMGAGPIGLLFTAVAKLSDVHPIIVSEPSPTRRALAQKVGADVVIDPMASDPVEATRDATNGGATVAVDSVGHQLRTGILSARKGGRVLLFGLDNRPLTLEESGEIVLRGLSILGIFISRNTLPRAVSLLGKHAQAFSPIITDVYPLSEWKSAFDRLLSGGADGKILVQPDRKPNGATAI